MEGCEQIFETVANLGHYQQENYLWKCVLKRGQKEEASAAENEEFVSFLMAPNGYFDHDLFSIIWGESKRFQSVQILATFYGLVLST